VQIRTCLIGCAIFATAASCPAQDFHPNIPKAWDDKEVAAFELPQAQRDRSPRYLTAEQYYALKVRPIYRSYPAYVTGREPAGYRESLKQKEPEIIFDASRLRTKEDWIRAGKLVFESGVSFRPAPPETPPVGRFLAPVSPDGVIPSFGGGYRYIVRRKGELELGGNSCAGCHTRVMADGFASRRSAGHYRPAPPCRDLGRLARSRHGRYSAECGSPMDVVWRALDHGQRSI
jgi:hypothetical protein